MKFTKIVLLLIISIFIQTSCTSTDTAPETNKENTQNTNTVSKIIITQGNTILTGSGETLQLSAQALNSDGSLVNTEVSWRSDKSDIVSVDDNGQITSFVAVGKASITAYIDGIESKPIDVTVATLAADIKLLRDRDIISVALKTPQLPPSANNTYSLSISKTTALEMGDKILGAGSVYFGGEIISLEQTEDAWLVTLLQLPLTEIFDDLTFNEKEKINDLTPYIKKEILQRYDVITLNNGDLQFTLKKSEKLSQPKVISNAISSQQSKATNPEALGFNLGAFECHYSSTMSVQPISFNVMPDQFVINHDIDFIFNFDMDTTGLQKIAIDGVIEAGIDYNINILPQLDGFAECELEVFAIEPSLPGIFVDLIPIDIPISIGFRVDGSLQSLAGAVQVSGFSTADIQTGIECDALQCQALFEGSASTDVDYAYQMATFETLNETTKANVSFMIYSTVGLRFWGFNFSSYLVGLSEKHTLASPAAQIANENNIGEYTLNSESGFIPGQNNSSIWDALNYLEVISYTVVDIQQNLVTNEISRSPLAVKMQANIAGAKNYDSAIPSKDYTLHFDISILPSSENYFRTSANAISAQEQYNIKEIVIFSVGDTQNITATLQEIARIPAEPGQTEFSFEVERDNFVAQARSTSYYAFATTYAGVSAEVQSGSEESLEYNLLAQATLDDYDVDIQGSASTSANEITYGPITINVTKNNQGISEGVEGIHIYYEEGQHGALLEKDIKTDIDGTATITFKVYDNNRVEPYNYYDIPLSIFINGKLYTETFRNPNYVGPPPDPCSPGNASGNVGTPDNCPL